MEIQQPKKMNSDAAHVHRCGEYDGVWNNHAADEHGAGRRDLAAYPGW